MHNHYACNHATAHLDVKGRMHSVSILSVVGAGSGMRCFTCRGSVSDDLVYH